MSEDNKRNEIRERKIVITGGSSEIGNAIIEAILKDGDHIIIQTNRNYEECKERFNHLEDRCEIVTLDFQNDSSIDQFCSHLNDVDILINAAAVTINAPLPHLSMEQINMMVDVNIMGLVKICRAAIPSMISRRSGKIINISSIVASRANRGQTVYAGTKGFIESFSRALAAEYGSRGIQVNCVAPGPIDAGSLKDTLGYAEKEVKESIVAKRLGTPQDVANAVRFLCDDESSFINGTTLKVDGGFIKGL